MGVERGGAWGVVIGGIRTHTTARRGRARERERERERTERERERQREREREGRGRGSRERVGEAFGFYAFYGVAS